MLQKGNDETKIETMKRVLAVMMGGDPLPSLLMPIIRFVMPSKSKPLKKLLYIYCMCYGTGPYYNVQLTYPRRNLPKTWKGRQTHAGMDLGVQRNAIGPGKPRIGHCVCLTANGAPAITK